MESITHTHTPRLRLIRLIKERMVVREDPITTAGGEQTTTYLDIPGVLRDSSALGTALHVFADHLILNIPDEVEVTMLAGPTTGAIPLVAGLPAQGGWYGKPLKWAIVRDEVKDHGLGRLFVGAEPGPGDKVILTDDVVSRGGSLAWTATRIMDTGAEVVAIAPLVDRGDTARKVFQQDVFAGIPYIPVLTYRDLGIDPL